MDFNSIIKTMTSSDSLSQSSSLTGTSENDVSSVLSSMLPQLLSGAQQQATSQDTAASFAKALTSHGQVDASDLPSFFGSVDMDDGAKIVNHLLGKETAVKRANEVSEKSGVSASTITSIISAAAPLLMSLMGKQATSENASSGGLDLSGIVGSLFGGGDNDGGGLGSILSGLFK